MIAGEKIIQAQLMTLLIQICVSLQQPSSFFGIISINQSKNQFELDCIDRHEDGEDCLFFSY